jgi:hypothetical protein
MSVLSEIKKSKYLKKEDCPLDLTISEVRQEDVALQGSSKPDLCWVLYFEEVEKGLILNTTNGTILFENTGSDGGDDGSPWIGVKVSLYNDKNVMFAGKRIGGIRIRSTAELPKGQPGDNEDIPF